jgi:hypothetical protein
MRHGRIAMRYPAASITTTVIVMLLLSVVPTRAAGDEGIVNTAPRSFHALSRVSEEVASPLVALSDDELASIAGGSLGNILNLGVVVQINVCAICSQVRQSNGASVGQVGVLRGFPR